ncbi:unnamed protein product [Meganyctiphanes norvegica]|uniref:VWFA domain-containing protein n=1 Tax=Meganyctiphanes norvegica TaxID=48144 RepID=A0AAV2RAF1_MEGNR
MDDPDGTNGGPSNWNPPPVYPGVPERYVSTTDRQRETQMQEQWRVPPLVPPDGCPEMEAAEEDNAMDADDSGGVSNTDAKLYMIKEQNSNGGGKIHSLLKMPSKFPASFNSENESSRIAHLRKQSTLNIFMGDVSESMAMYWPKVVVGWNRYVFPKLVGRTMVYTYGARVNFKHNTSEITKEDFDRDPHDNLTGALMTILEEIYMCKEKYINVFIVSDGGHSVTNCQPETVLNRMRLAEGKIVVVYVIGCGNEFPVSYSKGIRSQLHSGSSNLPTLFWANDEEENGDVLQQFTDISQHLEGGEASPQIELSVPGYILPKIQPQQMFHLDDYIYFDQGPDTLPEIELKSSRNDLDLLQLTPQDITSDILLDKVFIQWIGEMRKLRNRKVNIPEGILDFMKTLYDSTLNYSNKIARNLGNNDNDRLSKKTSLGYETKFRTIKNSVKALLTGEQYQDETDLAKRNLCTTVFTDKYAIKNLQSKGHKDSDFINDVKEFREVYRNCQANLASLEVSKDDCCTITGDSTLSDLQNNEFTQLLDYNKFEFLKQFTISGFPVYAPTCNSVQINSWTYRIRRILTSPNAILSQVAMEGMAESNPDGMGLKHKEMNVQKDRTDTKFNAIIPVFPPDIAIFLQPIMRTKLYAMCCTFAILKTPHIVDFNVHMAALGVAWIHLLFKFPIQPRPEYVQYQIKCIEATAGNYSDRRSFANYRNILKSNPIQAIIPESTTKVYGKILKCESLIKPIFILHLAKLSGKIVEISEIRRILELILLEYIGRCLSNYEKRHTPYCDFFAENMSDKEQREKFVKKNVTPSQRKIVNKEENLLLEFYYYHHCEKVAKIEAKEEVKLCASQLVENVPIKVSVEKVKNLQNICSCGDVSWITLQTFAKEIGLPDDDIKTLFSDINVFRYVAHALKHPNSHERLKTLLSEYSVYENEVKEKVKAEIAKDLCRSLFDSIMNEKLTSWSNAYREAHKEIVQPMTKSQIIQEASLQGITVNEENFDEVYKRFRPHVGLLGNACQCKKCPWYLKPHRSYNQHNFAERQTSPSFPHALHITTQKYRDSSVDEIIRMIFSGKCTKAKKGGNRKRKLENEDITNSLRHDISGLKDKYLQLPCD